MWAALEDLRRGTGQHPRPTREAPGGNFTVDVVEMSRKFIDKSRNFLEISRKFLDLGIS